jgi:hypothetical protein
LLPVAAVSIVLGLALAYVRPGSRTIAEPAPAGRPRLTFVERSAEAGLTFTHVNGMAGAMYFPEIMGPGVGLFDADSDGDLDVFVPQGRPLGGASIGSPPPAPPAYETGRLFRNDLAVRPDGTRTLRFTDVTAESGITADGYGMGVASGDFDNDGWIDLYLTNFGRNQLFRNNGDGTFSDVSKTSGTDDPGWSVSAAFVDYDRDGWLDLFVGHYLSYSTDANVQCRGVAGAPDYCAPFVYPAQPSRLLHNQRDGTFRDVTAAAGLALEFGPALGVSTADFNGDGWIDLYVAHDLQPNALWINQRDGTFKNTAAPAGVAVGQNGEPKSSMGVDAADFDNDGDEDLVVTELTGQGADLYVNDGTGSFLDESATSGLRAATLPLTGFGTAWFDADNDGWLDILTVNGAVMGIEPSAAPGDPFPFKQRKQLLRNLGTGRFEDVGAAAGSVFERPAVGRGAAFGDLDNDGDTDVVVANTNDRLELLMNESATDTHWIGLRLVGGTPQRDMTGARVSVERAGGTTLWRRARTDGSYASTNDARVLIGLGPSTTLTSLQVLWPDGRRESFTGAPIDRYTTLVEGTGTPSPAGSTQ